MSASNSMTTATSSPLPGVSRSVLQLQVLTIVWMTVEAIVSLGTAWSSHSPALLAFGGDSLIELLSAAVVFWRFRFELNEARAARIAGVLLFALAGLVMLTSVLNFLGYREAQRSLVGVGILLAAAVVMPWLASRKRKLAAITSSAALRADAAESSLCGYRLFPAEAARRLRFIRRAQELGFSLAEIGELLSLRVSRSTTSGAIRARAEAKIADIEAKIKSLESMKKTLRKLTRVCDGCAPLVECPILESLDGENA
jgi:MerR-like DNA binding protein